MKAAAVIGHSFDIQTLLKVNPFKNIVSTDKLISLLNDLSDNEFIEIMDQQEDNVIYRFVDPFMRDVLYQRLIFSYRRQMHRYVAEAIESIPNLPQGEEDQSLESNRLSYHWFKFSIIDILNILFLKVSCRKCKLFSNQFQKF